MTTTHKNSTKGSVMTRFSICALAILALAGCNTPGKDINRVQTNLVDKSIFQGEWWYAQTAIDVDSDEAMIGGTFNGDMGWADLGVDSGQSGSIARIRWVIDENYLYAYRAYELIDGGNSDGHDPDFRGQPIAAWAIQDHVDIRRDYDPVTGEPTKVTIENSSDRRWYERQYMRVDWSQNVISSFVWTALEVGPWNGYRAEPVAFFFQENSHADFPASYYPQFVRVGDDPDYRFASEWPADQQDTVHYMSFVTQSLLGPGANCLFYGIPCQTVAITYRHSFLRVPPNHQYASATQTHTEFDKFGLFRTYQRTYVRGGQNTDVLRQVCSSSADCPGGTACGADGYCTGGLTDDYGETDFLTFYSPRYNLYANPLTDQECLADWECTTDGSTCDRAARRCTVPVADRELRHVNYWLNPHYPEFLAPDAFMVVGRWNEAFMQGWRAARHMALPDYSSYSEPCQMVDPTRYCYCGSPEDSGGTCEGRYDPFVSPDEWASRGVTDPYDCYIQTDFTEPADPTSYEDFAGAYNENFVGDECIMVLHSNSCDLDPTQPCEDLGDIRYQFFNYIQHSERDFGGVSLPLVDPTDGELMSSNCNMAGDSVESAINYAVDYFPVLREEPGAQERYFTGENLRGYFERLGRVEHPVALAASGTDGYTNDDTSRPATPRALNAALMEDLGRRLPHIERLRGSDGRAQLMVDRMRSLAGTRFESQIVGSLGPDGRDLMHNSLDMSRVEPGTSGLSEDVLDQDSPFRGKLLDGLTRARRMMNEYGKRNRCFPTENLYRSAHWQWWADQFDGVDPREASIRLQKMFLRNVMYHEMGHSTGLRHNFGSSFDRDNYPDEYFRIAQENPLPRLDDYDDPRFGGDADGFVGGEEVGRYVADLREFRDRRAAEGHIAAMNASAMDYIDIQATKLGRYDYAATAWNYFGQIEALQGPFDPTTTPRGRTSSGDSLDGLMRSDEYPRAWWTYYRGGEQCNVDSDCPFSAGAAALHPDQPISQRCIQNPRVQRLPTPCDGATACVCSPFDEDFRDYVDGVAFRDPGGDPDYVPVPYLFCSDDRTNDISWCSRSDFGESFQEVVDDYRQLWEEGYPSYYYRRFRRTGAQGLASLGSIIDAAKIYQHLFFRLYYEPGFGSDTGPLGFNDQFLASIDAMNWFVELFNLPDTGSYRFNSVDNTYEHMGEEMDMAGSDFNLEPGEGFTLWSAYQDGQRGFFRTERAGTFMDKYFAIYGLALRDWGLNFTLDERFYINFYDLFPVEMTEFFGGVVLGEPGWYSARVNMADGEPQIEHISLYNGLALGECRSSGYSVPCRGPIEDVYTNPALSNETPLFLREWATILALAFFPVYYDTTFEQRLAIFKLDNGDGYTFPLTQPDGTPTCAYGDITIDRRHDSGCSREDADYVVFDSERFHTPYVATKIRSRITFNLEQEQLGFQLLAGMVDNQDRIQAIEAMGSPSAAELAELEQRRQKLTQDESFLEALIELQRTFGISSTYF